MERIMVDSLKVNLTAALVDNAVNALQATEVQLRLENTVGKLAVGDQGGMPRSVHCFTVRDARDVGHGNPHGLSAQDASLVLAIPCSFAQPRVLFSPMHASWSLASVQFGVTTSGDTLGTPVDMPTEGHVTRTASVSVPHTATVTTRLTTSAALDEGRVFDIAQKLLATGRFDTTRTALRDRNIRAAIESYQDAMESAGKASCYTSLYSALEKVVNADGTNRIGAAFDAAASPLTSSTAASIEQLREFNNRIKHALRNPKDLADLQDGEERLGQLAFALKRATDEAILVRM